MSDKIISMKCVDCKCEHGTQLIGKTNIMYTNAERDRAYANSPYDLGTDLDNAYRNGVDEMLGILQRSKNGINTTG